MRWDSDPGIMKAGFGPRLFWIDARLTVDDVTMKRVFDIRTARLCPRTPHSFVVGFVVGEEELSARVAVEIPRAELVRRQQIREWFSPQIVGAEADKVVTLGTNLDGGFWFWRRTP